MEYTQGDSCLRPVMSPPSESLLIDAARHLRRWSALHLARESGLAMGTIQEALSGLRGKGTSAIEVGPSVGTLLVLARTLELTPEQFRRSGREDAAVALELLGEEFDLSRVPIAVLVNALTKRSGGPELGSRTWVPNSSETDRREPRRYSEQARSTPQADPAAEETS